MTEVDLVLKILVSIFGCSNRNANKIVKKNSLFLCHADLGVFMLFIQLSGSQDPSVLLCCCPHPLFQFQVPVSHTHSSQKKKEKESVFLLCKGLMLKFPTSPLLSFHWLELDHMANQLEGNLGKVVLTPGSYVSC